MEERVTTMEGARREAWEEACSRIVIDALIGIYNIPRISQVQMIYRARLLSPEVAAGPESREVGLFDWAEIPWDELAFPSVHWALGHWRETRGKPSRSEARRVGKECVSTCRSRWSPYHKQNKQLAQYSLCQLRPHRSTHK